MHNMTIKKSRQLIKLFKKQLEKERKEYGYCTSKGDELEDKIDKEEKRIKFCQTWDVG